MLLLYLSSPPTIRQRRGPFTFHYASTLSALRIGRRYREMNLHSTMLLLYRASPDCTSHSKAKFTFHYASTLSVYASEGVRFEPPFTFHYASTLSLLLRIVSYCIKHLHSTMLLLYRPSLMVTSIPFMDLHSTMLLLYPSPGAAWNLPIANLHSTMLLLYLTALFHPPSVFSSFTFHYASTLSGLFYLLPGSVAEFTFHYASTLSRVPHPQLFGWCLIYIPLCFYFIKYTPLSVQVAVPNLHSTMLLLYPSPFSPSIFFNTSILFVYPTFFISLFSKIFLLPLYKI